MNQQINEFFESHPEANEVHEALGRLFLDKSKATSFLAGVPGKVVTTYTREGAQYAKKSEAIAAAIREQETVVDKCEVAYHEGEGVNKEQLMSLWKKEQFKLQQLHHELKRMLREEEKDAALEKKQPEEQLGEEFNITLGEQKVEETPVVVSEEAPVIVAYVPEVVTEVAAEVAPEEAPEVAVEEAPEVAAEETTEAPAAEETPVIELAAKTKKGNKSK